MALCLRSYQKSPRSALVEAGVEQSGEAQEMGASAVDPSSTVEDFDLIDRYPGMSVNGVRNECFESVCYRLKLSAMKWSQRWPNATTADENVDWSIQCDWSIPRRSLITWWTQIKRSRMLWGLFAQPPQLKAGVWRHHQLPGEAPRTIEHKPIWCIAYFPCKRALKFRRSNGNMLLQNGLAPARTAAISSRWNLSRKLLASGWYTFILFWLKPVVWSKFENAPSKWESWLFVNTAGQPNKPIHRAEKAPIAFFWCRTGDWNGPWTDTEVVYTGGHVNVTVRRLEGPYETNVHEMKTRLWFG